MNQITDTLITDSPPSANIDVNHINKVGFIMSKYPDKLANNIKTLCNTCAFVPKCNILPVTTNGEDCPYYKV